MSGDNAIATSATVNANELQAICCYSQCNRLAQTAQFQLRNEIWYVSTEAMTQMIVFKLMLPAQTVNGVLAKPEFISGDPIYVAEGIYTSTAEEVVLFDQNARVFGGWTVRFPSRLGLRLLMHRGYIMELR